MAKNHGTVSFFVKDLQTARKTGENFVQKDTQFVSVLLCGTVSNISWSNNREKIIYTVEDGTARINCIMESNRSALMNENNIEFERLKTQATSDNVLLQAALITATSSNQLLKRTYCQDIKGGDNVKIVGKLRQFHNSNYIFINQIEKISGLKSRVNYLRTLFLLYNNVYRVQVLE